MKSQRSLRHFGKCKSLRIDGCRGWHSQTPEVNPLEDTGEEKNSDNAAAPHVFLRLASDCSLALSFLAAILIKIVKIAFAQFNFQNQIHQYIFESITQFLHNNGIFISIVNAPLVHGYGKTL